MTMPFEYHISVEEHIVYVTGCGDEYLDEEFIQKILSDPHYDENINVLCDFTAFGKAPPLNEMKKIAQVYGKYKDRIRGNIAFVVPPADLRKASILAQFLRLLGIRLECYGNVKSAKKYLKTGISWVE